MSDRQTLRLATAFARAAAGSAPRARLCDACVDVLDVAGAGITIMSGTNAGPVCVSNDRMAALEDLQFTAGEGPCQDAYRSRSPVSAPQLDGTAARRWPGFIDLARSSGVNAVFAYPLVTARSKVGVLTIYQDRSGDLSVEQQEDSLAVAEVLTNTMLALQADARPGRLADDLGEAIAHRAEVHQATGMVAVQLGVPIAEALARIRAHAFAVGRPTGAVAVDIVARKLRLAGDPPAAVHPTRDP
ncbi:MAG: hypothetical protein JWM05_1864 [Acidimicrobiales bacterium]|nr:hypothetical protein [Acidimicrobiales bacterium]